MDTTLRLGDRLLSVTLPSGDADTATVDGTPHALRELARGPVSGTAGWLVEEIALELDGRPLRATVARGHDRVLVALAGRVFAFAVGDDAQRGAAHAGSGVVLAPMPGTVTRVLVAVGDTVDAGRPLVVLEAMKMETTLVAEVAGRVAAVHVEAGTMVDGGARLVDVAPA